MRSIACLIGLSLLSGCWYSILPIYDREDLIYDPALLGVWTIEDSSVIYLVTEGPDSAYSVEVMESDCDRGTAEMRLASIRGVRFLDVHGERQDDLAVPIHFIFLIDEQADSAVTLRALDFDWLEDHLDANPEAIAHVELDDDIVLTATTADLQRFHLDLLRMPDAEFERGTFVRLSDEAAERLIGRFVLRPAAPPPPPPGGGEVAPAPPEREAVDVLSCLDGSIARPARS